MMQLIVLAVSVQPVAHCCQLTLNGDLTLVVGQCCSYSFTMYSHRHEGFSKLLDIGCDQS
jgi:hypothetical protein